jgi:hypothetical protein
VNRKPEHMANSTHQRKTEGSAPAPRDKRTDSETQLPTWRNTRPRGNQEPHRQDLERSRERFEALLGR